MLLLRTDLCLKFFNRIHEIQKRDLYSNLEIESLIRALENEAMHIPLVKESIDYHYKYDKDDRSNRMIAISRFRNPFHIILKENDMDPLN